MKSFTSVSAILALTLSAAVLADEKCMSDKKSKPDDTNSIFNQDFGLSLKTPDLLSMISPFIYYDYLKPVRGLAALTRDVEPKLNTVNLGSVKMEENRYLIKVNVPNFAPEDIKVKTSNGYVVVEANHKDKEDKNEYSSRHFVTRYALPDGSDPERIVSELSDGILTVSVPRKASRGSIKE